MKTSTDPLDAVVVSEGHVRLVEIIIVDKTWWRMVMNFSQPPGSQLRNQLCDKLCCEQGTHVDLRTHIRGWVYSLPPELMSNCMHLRCAEVYSALLNMLSGWINLSSIFIYLLWRWTALTIRFISTDVSLTRPKISNYLEWNTFITISHICANNQLASSATLWTNKTKPNDHS